MNVIIVAGFPDTKTIRRYFDCGHAEKSIPGFDSVGLKNATNSFICPCAETPSRNGFGSVWLSTSLALPRVVRAQYLTSSIKTEESPSRTSSPHQTFLDNLGNHIGVHSLPSNQEFQIFQFELWVCENWCSTFLRITFTTKTVFVAGETIGEARFPAVHKPIPFVVAIVWAQKS